MCQKSKKSAAVKGAEANGQARRYIACQVSIFCQRVEVTDGKARRRPRQAMAAGGPLGDLPGLVWHPIKKKYFPIGADQDPIPKRNAKPETIRQRLESRKKAPEERRRKKELFERREGSRKPVQELKQCTRVDRTLLRATGLQLGYDRFSGPTSAEAQRRMR